VWPANYPGLPRTGWLPTVPVLLARPDTVSRHVSAAVTMLENGLTRLGTTNDGSTEHGVVTLCHRVAVYSGPFRWHEMTVVEIIIVILHCQTDNVLACVRSYMISSDIWTPGYRKLDESTIDIAISRNRYDFLKM